MNPSPSRRGLPLIRQVRKYAYLIRTLGESSTVRCVVLGCRPAHASRAVGKQGRCVRRACRAFEGQRPVQL